MANRQFYFLIFWDEEDGNWYVDNETCVGLGWPVTVWDGQEGEWHPVREGSEETLDTKLCSELEYILSKHNQGRA